jgi:hypothetical protein
MGYERSKRRDSSVSPINSDKREEILKMIN